MSIPVQNIIAKIQSETSMSDDEIHSKIKSKMEELAGLVSEEGAAHILANELNIKLNLDESQEVKVDEIKPFMRNISVIGKVTQIYDLIEFERNSNPGKVRSCIIGDDSGKIRASFWHSAAEAIADVKIGDILKIAKCASRENNGRSEVSVSFGDQIEINPAGVEIEVSSSFGEPKIKKIVELGEDKYGAILGTIVQVFKPSFYFSCPECRKRLKDDKCPEHGDVKKNLSYVLNVFLDDGTDSMRCVFFNEQAEILTGYSNSKFQEISEDESKFEILKNLLLGNLVKISGSIRFSSFSNRNELVVNNVTVDLDPTLESANL